MANGNGRSGIPIPLMNFLSIFHSNQSHAVFAMATMDQILVNHYVERVTHSYYPLW